MKINEMILYKNTEFYDNLVTMEKLYEGGTGSAEEARNIAAECIGDILTLSEKMGFKGNLWHDYLAYIIAYNENAFSMSCERKGSVEGGINACARHDFTIFMKLFDIDLADIDRRYGTCLSMLINFDNNNEHEKYFNKRIRDRIIRLAENLAKAEDVNEFYDTVCSFYKEVGVGKYGMFKAFRIGNDDNGKVVVNPVISVEHIYLKDIIGYEQQKKKLVDNTEAFLHGLKANNVLLFGDSGTGKSSSIKAILNEYYEDGLRMIEVYKHQFKDLSAVINQIKDRDYKFIIYMDDLSFEEFEIEYKFLKAVIEGGLEKKPDNVLIYATSNRRHLVREKYSDKEERDDDLHSRDTVQEKLSLSARFGVSIYYGSPDKKEFTAIVKGLAQRNNIDIDEETLLLEANKWELSHRGLSGRTAEQFINYLSYKLKTDNNR